MIMKAQVISISICDFRFLKKQYFNGILIIACAYKPKRSLSTEINKQKAIS